MVTQIRRGSYRDQAEQTLEVYAGVAGQHGIFAATYGLAVVRFIQPHTQVVVVGKDEVAAETVSGGGAAASLENGGSASGCR